MNQNNEYLDINKNEAKKAYRKVILGYIIYFVLLQILAVPFNNLNANNLLDPGLYNILIFTIPLMPLYFWFGKSSMNVVKERKENHLDFKGYIFFFGLMYIATIVFGQLTNLIMKLFNLQSIDVTATIQSQMTVPMFIYVVLVGPFIEELQYRGFYLNHIRKFGVYAPILLSAILFSFAHLNFIQGFGTLGLGIILSYVGYFYSFKSSVVLHMINNLFVASVGMVVNNLGEESPAIIVLSIGVILCAIYAVLSLFREERKNKIKRNLKFDQREKTYLKYAFFDYGFIGYLIFIIFITYSLSKAINM